MLEKRGETSMKLTAQKDEALDDDYVDIRYRTLTPAIHQIFQLCEETGSVLLCEKDGATHRVDVNDVLYIEAVDRKSCVCTRDEVFTMPTPLSQLEDALASKYFVRISRMALINIYKIKSVSNGLNFRLTAEMVNGEKIIINRYYRGALLEAIQELAEEVTR
jgi:DNA-binding LytR/AlgR family response regulator